MSENPHICTICNRVYSTKYTLANHIKCVHKKDESSELKCTSDKCNFKTMYLSELKKHTKKCSFLLIENECEKIKIKHKEDLEKMKIEIESKHVEDLEKMKMEFESKHKEDLEKIIEYEKQISNLQTEKNIMKNELEHSRYLIQTLSEQAINRPTNVTTNQQHNEIGNTKITHYLSDNKKYQRQVHPQRLVDLLDNHFEDYFMDGQSGLARFVVEHVVRVDDGKMILCCTDPIRKRFRFINAEGKLAEDLKAKMFCSKIKIPVNEMCSEVFDRIINKLTEEKKVKLSSGKSYGIDIEFLDKKIDLAERRFLEIKSFDGDDGSEFLNELACLLRNPNDILETIDK